MERLVAGTLRPAHGGDLDAVEALENAAFSSDRLSRRSLRHFLRSPATTEALVVENEAGLLGYAMVGFRRGSVIARLFSLAVDGRAARQGVGRALLAGCEAAARQRERTEVRLEVRVDNPAAIALYETSGYRRMATTPDFYEDGTAAHLFRKALDAPD